MIISVSRRSDIPSYYSDWFFNRLQEKFVLVRNPINPHRISRLSLTEDAVDCFVFWSKNPAPMLTCHYKKLKELTIPFYFQFTLTAYERDIECNLPSKSELKESFKRLSDLITPARLIWRYDPILCNHKYNTNFHLENFSLLAEELSPYTSKVIISFVDFYRKIDSRLRELQIFPQNDSEKLILASQLQKIAAANNLKISACAEQQDFSEVGISRASCIDADLINFICNGKVNTTKDKNQRLECNCISSIDIGCYNSCCHGCCYCYANSSVKLARSNHAGHNPFSPLLIGEVTQDDVISERKITTSIDRSVSLF